MSVPTTPPLPKEWDETLSDMWDRREINNKTIYGELAVSTDIVEAVTAMQWLSFLDEIGIKRCTECATRHDKVDGIGGTTTSRSRLARVASGFCSTTGPMS